MHRSNITGYDIIGDVHGHAGALDALLGSLGYVKTDSTWGHRGRQAVFVGDLIDRGAHQIRTVQLVRSMVDAGTAQMVIGNHEYNAVAFATEAPVGSGNFLRQHSDNHVRQHEAFLSEVEGSELYKEFLDWFCTLPLWIELSLGDARLRVVHACWHQKSIELLRPMLSASGSMTPELVFATSQKGTPEYDALEIVLKGPEIDLDGRIYLDEGGHPRARARQRWWDHGATTLRQVALIPAGSTTPEGQPFPDLPDTLIDRSDAYPDDIPVVVGHYWCTGPVERYSPLVACVDYSVANNGPLVAYRWNGERELINDHYVAHHVQHPNPEDNSEQDTDNED